MERAIWIFLLLSISQVKAKINNSIFQLGLNHDCIVIIIGNFDSNNTKDNSGFKWDSQLYEDQVLLLLDEVNAKPLEYEIHLIVQWGVDYTTGHDVLSRTAAQYPYFFRSVLKNLTI